MKDGKIYKVARKFQRPQAAKANIDLKKEEDRVVN